MTDHTIYIAKDFSKFPAGRFKEDGSFSGEHFREDVLIPSLNKYSHITVVLDGVAGFGSSFLEESFGGLKRSTRYSPEELLKRLTISTSEPDLEDYVALSYKFIRER